MAPTTLDSSWQLKWKRFGREICLFVLFLFIQKQFQQVHCGYRSSGGIESWSQGQWLVQPSPKIELLVAIDLQCSTALHLTSCLKENRIRDDSEAYFGLLIHCRDKRKNCRRSTRGLDPRRVDRYLLFPMGKSKVRADGCCYGLCHTGT